MRCGHPELPRVGRPLLVLVKVDFKKSHDSYRRGAEAALRMSGKHHEIYLTDARRVEPAKLQTIFRQPVQERQARAQPVQASSGFLGMRPAPHGSSDPQPLHGRMDEQNTYPSIRAAALAGWGSGRASRGSRENTPTRAGPGPSDGFSSAGRQ